MPMAQIRPDDADSPAAGPPRTAAELREWLRARFAFAQHEEQEIFEAIDQVLGRQRQLIEESKRDAIRALSEGFADKMQRLQKQLTEKDITVSNIARYFEEVVAELTEKSH